METFFFIQLAHNAILTRMISSEHSYYKNHSIFKKIKNKKAEILVSEKQYSKTINRKHKKDSCRRKHHQYV